MKQKFFLIVLALLCFYTLIPAKKSGVAEGIFRPKMMKVAHNTVYISDHYSISLFSTENFKLIKKIGRKGKGPGEFSVNPGITCIETGILTYIPFRISFYSPSGILEKELKYNDMPWDMAFLKGNYLSKISRFWVKKKFRTLSELLLLDNEFKKIKSFSILRIKSASRPNKKNRPLVVPLNKFQCHEGKIYLVKGDQSNFQIEVLDHRGSLLKIIRKDYNPIKIPDAYKIKKIEEHKNKPAIKKRWHILSKISVYTFPEYFPAIQDFRVRNGKIYVKSYRFKNESVEFFVLDLNGKLLGKYFLPDIVWRLYDIRNNLFFYLQENEDEDIWEIHSLKIQ